MRSVSDELAQIEARGLRRRLRPVSTAAGAWLRRDGRRLLNLASNNYLDLAGHPEVVEAACEAARRWGVGAGASRLLCGDTDLHHALESDLADLKGTEAALVFSSGYAANVGVLTTLLGRGDQVFSDRLNHASLIDGVRLSGARCHIFDHRDAGHLERLMAAAPTGGRRLVVTDGVFSMDGELAPLPDLARVAERHGGLLLVDDAHATGVVGPEGRGSVQCFGLDGRAVVQVATLSKALGVQGGFAAVSRSLKDLLIHRARSQVFSTGLSPMLAGAARRALTIARAEGWRRRRQQEHVERLARGLRELGYEVRWTPPAPMLVAIIGAPRPTLELSARLEKAGVLVPAIRPPTVPEGSSRLRFAPMAAHSTGDMDRVLEAVPPAP